MTQTPASRTPSAPDDATPEPDSTAPEAPKLSLTQIVASALAAVSTTVLMSYFGIAGTIIGAGAASVVTVLANYFYTRSIQRTHAQLKPVVSHLAPRGRTTTTTQITPVPRGEETQPLPRARGAETLEAVRVPRGTTTDLADSAADPTAGSTADSTARTTTDTGDDASRPGPWFRLIDRYGKGKVLAASAALLFVVVMGVVLVVELAIGKPLSDAVRGQEGSGTSISRTTTVEEPVTPLQDEPSGTTSEEPVPADEPTDPATEDPAPAPTEDPTSTPTDEPTEEPETTPEPTDPATPGTGSDGSGTAGPGEGAGSAGTGGGTGTGTGTGESGDASGEDTGSTEQVEPTPTPSASVGLAA
ncbi:hypothetical protein [Cellulosimicrobium marinum]|uniref:hypothetical protein n=1 Tax=Cellulosimicrobium marinum TaxID=1638992 RepID=UPI001E5B433D|nr:hypothetical protein [Cellulosimicrobium marinum]MCB7136973.1 hypothetical protein [Cellulosimicrobium marinum]